MISVPAGHVLRYGYARHGFIAFEQYGGQQWDAVLRHAQAVADIGNGAQLSDCPFGYWKGTTFIIQDGRHRYLALVGLGFRDLLVRWLEPDVRETSGLVDMSRGIAKKRAA